MKIKPHCIRRCFDLDSSYIGYKIRASKISRDSDPEKQIDLQGRRQTVRQDIQRGTRKGGFREKE